MKAVVQRGYGSPDEVLGIEEIDVPAIGDDEVLVRVRAASVHPDVWHVVNGWPYVLRLLGAGVRRPKDLVPGTDVAGTVESVGSGVTRFLPGDAVFGESVRGHQWRNGGAFAEYVAVPEDALALKPEDVSFDAAASVPTSGIIAIPNLTHGRIQPGQKVLINGAGGGVGAIAIQVARTLGAEVTGVDSSDKLDMVRSLGADHVIDYTREDFTQGSERYDLIFDIPGNHPFSECRRALTPAGTYILIGHDSYGRASGRLLGSMPRLLKLAAMSPFVSQLPSLRAQGPDKKETLALLGELLEAGKLTPIIDRTYPLDEVAGAIRYLESGQARGRVIISMGT